MMPTDLPREETRPGLVVPLFPLPDLILFPGVLLPLHVFEARYRQMVGDLLDMNGNLVMGTVLEANQREDLVVPAVEPVAGIGQVENYQQLEDGRFLILIRGVARVWIREVPSDRLYRKVMVQAVEETAPESPEEESALQTTLARAVETRSPQPLNLPDGVSVSQLSDLLLIQLGLDPEILYHHYALLDVGERARNALLLHQSQSS